MKFDVHLETAIGSPTFKAHTIREIIFSTLSHRPETSVVITGHHEERLIEVSLKELRAIICDLSAIIKNKNLFKGDTVLLTSFYSSNELGNAILFSAFACLGIRVFIPIYPEVDEFEEWRKVTNFKAVILPSKEILLQQGHEREKQTIDSFASLCKTHEIPLWDTYEDFGFSFEGENLKVVHPNARSNTSFVDNITPETEAVIFTTSGTSGKSRLVMYTQGSFSISCQSWQNAGLFDEGFCGNKGFTPLFTHTIGIRTFINALWTGNAICLIVADWFLHKPEIARYLLLQMQPGHIVGGPALFNLLLEFFRHFPELKSDLRNRLKTAISIGAPYSVETARQIRTALGLNLCNAFGTTETQMVSLNRAAGNENLDNECLGEPLPGVSIGLKEVEPKGTYELYVYSPYKSSFIIDECTDEKYFFTGDLVSSDAHGKIRYAIRKGTDFIKDDFGVKVPIAILKEYYPLLYKISRHIEWFSLKNKPGLAALIFLHPSFYYLSLREVSEWLKNRNEILHSTLQPFEFTHRQLQRFTLEIADLPLTKKGTVSRKEMLTLFQESIYNLKNSWVSSKQIESVEVEKRSLLYQFSNPRLATLLEALKIDVHFNKGEKDTLYYSRNGKQQAVLDLVGGFGAGLLGHNHPTIKNAIKTFIESGQTPLNNQGSLYHYPSLLACELNRLFSKNTGKYFKVQFGNTGSEALEIALHHAYYGWRAKLKKRRDEQLQLYGCLEDFDVHTLWEQNLEKAAKATAAVIVVNDCFHGYTLGARSLLNNKKQRYSFSGLLKPIALQVNDANENWIEQIEAYKSKHQILLDSVVKEEGRYVVRPEPVCTIIASIIEPVRGEGGICETKIELAEYLSQQHFPLISDEIQCGLGRTGSLPAYPNASYYLLGKSLGGGYEKISAVLIDDNNFRDSFSRYYTSTFANGELAACASLAALDVIVKENYAATALKKGNEFITKLTSVSQKYGDIIESITGKGLMLGVNLNKAIGEKNILLRALIEHEHLGYMFSGWLFHNKNIRVLPSLSRPNSLRLEPSVYIETENINYFCNALEELCILCREGRMYQLFRYLMNDDRYFDKIQKSIQGKLHVEIEEAEKGAIKVGFIGNFTAPPKELMLIEPDLKKASETGLRILFDKMQTLLNGKAIHLFSKNLMQGKINFTFYILPFDTAQLEAVNRWGKKRLYVSQIQEVIDKMAKEGITYVSLGAHTSIISDNGLRLAETQKVKIVTGNTLTVASCLYHLGQHLEKINSEINKPVTIAIVGANGNIGAGFTGCFDDEKYATAKIILIGNHIKNLEQLRNKVFNQERSVECTTDLFQLHKADIIVSCTNTNDPLIFPHHVHSSRKVFIIDISVPGSVSEEVKLLSNVEFCKDSSSVFLPDDPDFLISTHTPVGKIFCCAAEAILTALYHLDVPLKGHLNPVSIKKMMECASTEGIFTKREYASFI